MHTRKTLLLDKATWDLTLDAAGLIAMAHGNYATAQNVANECRLFTGDAYFIPDKGIPHFVIDLGRRVSRTVLRSYLRRAAYAVPDVKEVRALTIETVDPKTRILTGDIQFTSVEGEADGAIRTDF